MSGEGPDIIVVAVDRDQLIDENDSATIKVRSNGGEQEVRILISRPVYHLPPHWDFTAETGCNGTIILPADVSHRPESRQLENGDIIGVFTANGLCAG
ncbi:hypothetical protein JXO59_00220 [candidate division KSB1 bacterium]|nr:hypothetical protein [candidate division KSB1 bacterium]